MEKDNDLLMGLKDRRALKALVEKSINRGELENFYSVLSLASKQDFSVEDFELFVNGDVLKDILEFREYLKGQVKTTYGADEDDFYRSKRYNRLEDLVVMFNMLPVEVSNEVFVNNEAIDLISNLDDERFNKFCEGLDLDKMDIVINGLEKNAQDDKVEDLCEWKFAKEHAMLRNQK